MFSCQCYFMLQTSKLVTSKRLFTLKRCESFTLKKTNQLIPNHSLLSVFNCNQTLYRQFSIMSASKIYSLIDDILNDLDNAPKLHTSSNLKFSSNAKQQQQSSNNINNQQQQPQGRKKKKRRVREKKQNNQPKAKIQTQKASKRAAKLTTMKKLPDPTFKNGIKCM